MDFTFYLKMLKSPHIYVSLRIQDCAASPPLYISLTLMIICLFMKTLRTYVLNEFFPPFIISLAVFTSIMLIGRLTKQAAELIVNKGVAVLPVLKLIAYSMPYLLSFTLPVSILSAILLTYSKLSSDNEITAMRASGIGLDRVIFPQVILAVLISLACIPMNDRLVTKAHFEQRKILQEIGWKKPTALLEPGRPIDDFDGYTLFLSGLARKNKQLRDVTI